MTNPAFHFIPAETLDRIESELRDLREAVKSLPHSAAKRSRWLTQSEVEELLDISRSTLHRLRKDGAIPYVQHGRKILFRREDVDAFLEAHLQAA